MIIKNVSGEDLSKALERLSKQYDNNIIWNNYERLGDKRFRVTLRVVDSHGKGAKVNYNPFTDKHRRSTSACFHVHGKFFDILLAIQPNAIIKTGRTKIYKDEFGRTIGNWEDWNIGSQMYPWYYSEACECNR